MLFEEAPRAPEFLARLHELQQFSAAAAAKPLQGHPEARAGGELNAHIVVATIDSLVHRLVTTAADVDFQRVEDEIVALLTGYLRRDAKIQ
jgi:hypothetical protein